MADGCTHALPPSRSPHGEGTGPLYQGRFKSFPVQEGDHLRAVLRRMWSGTLRAGLLRRAEDWRWSSLGRRSGGLGAGLLDNGPEPLPEGWLTYVNGAETEAELEALRRSAARGRPYGEESWVGRTAVRLGLESSLRPRGRPRKTTAEKQ